VSFTLLGPVRVAVVGRSVDLGPGKQRCLAAVLLLSAGQPVPVATLIDRTWGERPPAGARGVLATYVTRLRRMVEAAGAGPSVVFRFVDGGYRVDCAAAAVDVHRSRLLATQAREAAASGDDQRAADGFRAALRDWQPVALAGVPGDWAVGARAGLGRERLALLVDVARAELRLGRTEQVIAELGDLVDEHPSNEDLAAELIGALLHGGQSVQALRCYERLRVAVADELGTEPSARLRELHLRILRENADPAPAAAGSVPPERAEPASSPAAERVVPAQLPADVYGFAGREEHLARLDALLTRDGPAVVTAAVSGTGGVGKTALAVHWAHRVADRFPDGQLYVNLRGFGPGGRPTTPGEAVRGFLGALGVPADRVPPGLDAQVGLYRSLLAGKRVLVLLDNVRDAEHARPLLPGAPTARAVVTSRDRLLPLVATEGAQPLTLDVLTADEARQLLAGRLGEARLTEQQQAVEEIIACCAQLPLALTIAAARAATRPTLPLAAVASDLRDATGRLDALTAGDPGSDVRTVLSWSYTRLTAPAARLFRLLGAHPGPEISAAAAASLAGRPLPEALRPLAELTGASLLTEHTPGRYTLHDLLSTYAADLSVRSGPDGEHRAAVGRMLDHYVHSGYAACRRVDPHRRPPVLPLGPAAPGAIWAEPAGHDQAMAWLGAERPVLVAAVDLAARTGHDLHVWQLAWILDQVLHWQGEWQALAGVWQVALDAARRLDDPAPLAYAHQMLATTYNLLDRNADAHVHLGHALDVYTRAGDRGGQGHTHLDLGFVWDNQGRPDLALEHDLRALALFRALGNRRSQARALNAAGWDHAQLGNHEQALEHCRQAVELQRDLGDRHGEAATLDSIGFAHQQLGQFGQAAECYHRATEIHRDLGDRHQEATTLVHLGDSQHAAGDPDAAATCWQRALDIFADLGHADAVEVRTKLATLDRVGSARPIT
jgi:DNA-binding SARP family transcriptional activator/Tfp pilus assembly protein PilF